MATSISSQVKTSGSFAGLPTDSVANVRNDMYLTSETIRWLQKDKAAFEKIDKDTVDNLKAFKEQTDAATKFIPLWVKISVAIALGLGTMVGWKRIVVTVGEKIGKTHLTYGQGASAELVAMMTIGAADIYGLPVSTTQVLSSGVAGTMVANGSGMQASTIRSLALAWILTLPVAMCLSGFLFWLFSHIF
jgi:PiT family inorganic phosphate transporter